MVDGARLFSLRLAVNVSPVFHSFLCQIEIIPFGIVRAEGGEGPVRRPLENRHGGILFFDPGDRLFNVIDIDSKVVQPRNIAWFPANHGYADVAVADADRVIRPDRLLFLRRAWLGSPHAEHSFVKLGLSDEVFTDDRSVLN